MMTEANQGIQDICDAKIMLNGEKKVYYQPFYNVGNHCIWGAEALFRLRNPDSSKHGFYNMELLAQKAEEEGWISVIDQWLFRQVCKHIPTLKESGIKRVNINLSPAVCLSQKLPERIQQTMQRYGVSKSDICLEITEMYKIKDESSEQFIQLATELKSMGIRLAMDDFGKGESNLLRLAEIPFSTLKIDKDFVWKMESSEKISHLLEVVIQMSHMFGIQVTAEGVETETQARILATYGCDFLQGYYISRPIPYEELLRFMEKNRFKNYLPE